MVIVNTPPHNAEAEKSLLSCLLLDQSLLSICVSNNLKPISFYRKEFGYIYKAMLDVFYSEFDIDVVTLSDQLSKDWVLEVIGWVDYLYELSTSVFTTNWFIDYLKIVLEKARLRWIIRSMEKFIWMAYDQENSDNVIGNLRASMFEYLNSWIEDAWGKIDRAYNSLVKSIKSWESVEICNTWYPLLNAYTGWFMQWHIWVIGASTAMGKSTLALNFLINAVNQWIRCCMFSMEVSCEEISKKIMCRMSWIPSDAFKQYPVPQEVIDRVDEVQPLVEPITNNLYVYDKINKIEDIYNQIYSLAWQWVKIFCVDHLLLIRSNTKKSDNKHYEIADYVNSFKSIAQELEVCIILISQFNRKADDMILKEPKISYFSGSSAIEQIANVAIWVYRPEKYPDECVQDDYWKLDLHILKNRDGKDGVVRLWCDMWTSQVYSIEEKKPIYEPHPFNIEDMEIGD